MTDLISQVELFKQWMNNYLCDPPKYHDRDEYDYPDWHNLHRTTLQFIDNNPFVTDWSSEQLEAIIYAIARDNEGEYLAETICETHPETLIQLAKAAIKSDEYDAKWQLASELSLVSGNKQTIEAILVELIQDSNEYVRRRSLMSLAEIGSNLVEDLALELWNNSQENREYTRISVLWSLHKINSPHLELLCLDARLDPSSNVSAYAQGILNGELSE